MFKLVSSLRIGSRAQRALVQLADVVDVVGEALDLIAQGLDSVEEVLLRQARGVRMLWLLRLLLVLTVAVILQFIVVILGVGIGLQAKKKKRS